MTTHAGPVTIRWSGKAQRRVLVLCPLGHLITGQAITPDSWPGSTLEAKISAHQHGNPVWTVTCDGALPQQFNS